MPCIQRLTIGQAFVALAAQRHPFHFQNFVHAHEACADHRVIQRFADYARQMEPELALNASEIVSDSEDIAWYGLDRRVTYVIGGDGQILKVFPKI